MPRAGLSHAAVVAEAGRLADEVGLENLTLAALAGRLGVRQPSLYKHVASLSALRLAIALGGLAELTDALARAAVGKSKDDAIWSMAHAYRRWAKDHPGRYQAIQRAPAPGDRAHEAAGVRAVALFNDALAGFGLSGDDAVDAIRSLRSALHGFVSLEMEGGFPIPLDIDRSYVRLVQTSVTSFSHPPYTPTRPQDEPIGGSRAYR